MAETKTQQKPKQSANDSKPMPEALQRAHEARQKKQARLDSLTKEERAAYDVKQIVNKAGHVLHTGRGSLSSTMQKNRKLLTDSQKAKVVEYLHQLVEEVERGTYGKKEQSFGL